jgi:hypothetical protein
MGMQQDRDGLGNGAVRGEWISHAHIQAALVTICQERQNVLVHDVTKRLTIS